MNKAKQIYEERSKKYGNAAINYQSFTKIIQAMVEQATQSKLPVDLPPDFGAMVMVQCKMLRQCYAHDDDNYLDATNYLQIGEETLDE